MQLVALLAGWNLLLWPQIIGIDGRQRWQTGTGESWSGERSKRKVGQHAALSQNMFTSNSSELRIYFDQIKGDYRNSRKTNQYIYRCNFIEVQSKSLQYSFNTHILVKTYYFPQEMHKLLWVLTKMWMLKECSSDLQCTSIKLGDWQKTIL